MLHQIEHYRDGRNSLADFELISYMWKKGAITEYEFRGAWGPTSNIKPQHARGGGSQKEDEEPRAHIQVHSRRQRRHYQRMEEVDGPLLSGLDTGEKGDTEEDDRRQSPAYPPLHPQRKSVIHQYMDETIGVPVSDPDRTLWEEEPEADEKRLAAHTWRSSYCERDIAKWLQEIDDLTLHDSDVEEEKTMEMKEKTEDNHKYTGSLTM